MKIIHTSDWHIGHMLYNWDRADEHQAFFDALLDTVLREHPDLMVVSGDVFHTSAPSSASQKLYVDNMLRIHKAYPEMTIVVIAGNHDSSAKIEVDRALWKHFNLHAIGSIDRIGGKDILDRHIIPVGNPVKGYVAAVPHCYPQNFPVLEGENVPREDRPTAFYKALLERVSQINCDGLPIVMMAHSTVIGSDPRKQDIIVGGLDSVNLSRIGEEYDYLALGHIHYPQNIGRRARYSGSPIPVSFNEDYAHSITVVETDSHQGEILQRVVEIPVKRSVVTLPEEAVEFDDALKLLYEFPDDEEAYIRLNVRVKQYGGADWTARASAATEGKKCRYCCILLQTMNDPESSGGPVRFSQEEMKEKNPLEVAMLYWHELKGEEMDQELVNKMAGVINKDNEA